MQKLTLTVADHAIDKVMALLNDFPKQDVQIRKENFEQAKKSVSVDDLYGILSPYVNGRLSDKDIENAIAQGACESGMAGLNG